MLIRWQAGGRLRDPFQCRTSVCSLYVCSVRDHDEGGTEDDDPLWGLLLRDAGGLDDCGELGDVVGKTLGLSSSLRTAKGAPYSGAPFLHKVILPRPLR